VVVDMGSKLLWLGLTILLALPELVPNRVFALVGAIIMIIGVILLFLDK
jgi:membrane-bound ClpP family serine protease